ncbi:MAG: hypothetical protein F4103_05175 [Boseongicola sp. SB0673_bin_14]|nr:hypothetical protein [Boseongicola sp. SB0673_bin_14]
MCGDGLGGHRKPGKAIKWTRKAAEQGHRAGRRFLVQVHLDGEAAAREQIREGC